MSSLPERESEIVEFKREWTNRAIEDLAAFVNHDGGTVFIGIEDDGSLTGWTATDAKLQSITNQVVESLGIRPRVEWLRHEDKDILALHVDTGATPVSYKGRYYTRVSSTNREMTGEQLAARFIALSGTSWDSLISNVGVEDVDDDAYEAFLRRAQSRLPESARGSSRELVLENLDLARDGKLTNAGVLLATTRPQRVFARAELRVGRFSNGEILDTVDIQGPLLVQFEEAIQAIRKHLRVRLEIDPKDLTPDEMERKDVWEFPAAAIREAVANALIHRDYTAVGHIQIRIGDGELRVWSPGGLPADMSMEKLRDENHGSRPRNPVMAQAFYYAGIIEKWGAGTTLMIRACRDQELPDPVFSETMGGFEVTFGEDRTSSRNLQELDLQGRHLQIVAHVKKHGRISNRQVRELLEVSARTSARLLTELVEQGVLAKEGTTRDAHYVLLV